MEFCTQRELQTQTVLKTCRRLGAIREAGDQAVLAGGVIHGAASLSRLTSASARRAAS
jgi:hypothetical protein